MDRYVWLADLDVNVKLREGAEDGLKLKRFLGREGAIERWREDPEEVFPFPLGEEAWAELARALDLPPPGGLPSGASGPSESLEILRGLHAALRVVTVRKRRVTRRYEGVAGPVSVEWARISEPEDIGSIGVEALAGDGGEDGPGVVAAALGELGLEAAPVRPMSYLDALDVWVGGGRIGDPPSHPIGADATKP